jgi:hypothetical protein
MKLLIMMFSPLPLKLVPLRPKYSSENPILKHRQQPEDTLYNIKYYLCR